MECEKCGHMQLSHSPMATKADFREALKHTLKNARECMEEGNKKGMRHFLFQARYRFLPRCT